MVLIGFSWIIIACLCALVVTKVLPGKWDEHGPAVAMMSGTSAAFFGMFTVLVTDGINSFGPSSAHSGVGLVMSALGGLIGFAAYVMDVKKQAQAQ